MENKYYSQNDEEAVILRLFEEAGVAQGRFLDIGAYDGKAFSNTYRLVELGWGGVCIEPSPTVFPALLNLHAGNSDIDLVNAAVAVEPGLVEFYDSGGDAISTTSIAHVQKWQRNAQVRYKRFFVSAISLAQVFSRFGFRFDFINLDVEAANLEIYKTLPFALLTGTRVLCVEHDNEIEQLTGLAAPHGFKAVHTTGENIIFSRP